MNKQLELYIQSNKYWFEVPRDPSLAFNRPESPEIGKMSLKMGNVRHILLKPLKSK
jgi:hypothetical protein